jgi:hypothetical protein
MIIVNGTICIKTKTGGELVNGNPVRPSESWSEPIPCNIKTNLHNNKGRVNGNSFEVASYEVLIEAQPFDADRVKLERQGKELGEFSVQDIELLYAVGCVKIVV